jgi:hypothetical protein
MRRGVVVRDLYIKTTSVKERDAPMTILTGQAAGRRGTLSTISRQRAGSKTENLNVVFIIVKSSSSLIHYYGKIFLSTLLFVFSSLLCI